MASVWLLSRLFSLGNTPAGNLALSSSQLFWPHCLCPFLPIGQGIQSTTLQTPPFILAFSTCPLLPLDRMIYPENTRRTTQRNSSKEVVRPQGVKMLLLVKTFFPLKLRVSCFREPGYLLHTEKQPLHHTGGMATTAHTLLCQDTLTNICLRFSRKVRSGPMLVWNGGPCLREAEPLKTQSHSSLLTPFTTLLPAAGDEAQEMGTC